MPFAQLCCAQGAGSDTLRNCTSESQKSVKCSELGSRKGFGTSSEIWTWYFWCPLHAPVDPANWAKLKSTCLFYLYSLPTNKNLLIVRSQNLSSLSSSLIRNGWQSKPLPFLYCPPTSIWSRNLKVENWKDCCVFLLMAVDKVVASQSRLWFLHWLLLRVMSCSHSSHCLTNMFPQGLGGRGTASAEAAKIYSLLRRCRACYSNSSNESLGSVYAAAKEARTGKSESGTVTGSAKLAISSLIVCIAPSDGAAGIAADWRPALQLPGLAGAAGRGRRGALQQRFCLRVWLTTAPPPPIAPPPLSWPDQLSPMVPHLPTWDPPLCWPAAGGWPLLRPLALPRRGTCPGPRRLCSAACTVVRVWRSRRQLLACCCCAARQLHCPTSSLSIEIVTLLASISASLSVNKRIQTSQS